MNIINTTLIRLVLAPSRLFRAMGVDDTQLRAILTTKLLMDDRRPNTLHQTGRSKNKPVTLSTVGTMLLSAVMGLLYLLAFNVGTTMVTSLVFYFTMFFVMLSATLISDFTSVLIDVRDSFIILPKPVNDRTVVVARMLHILIHILKIVLPMSMPGVVYVAMRYGGAGAALFLLTVLFLTCFTIFFINTAYILILRVTTPQKFQAIISYVQVLFAIIIYAGYQVFPRLIGELGPGAVDINAYPAVRYYPLYWIALFWQVAYHLEGRVPEILLASLGLLLPFASLYAFVKYLAPTFNNRISLITAGTSAGGKVLGQKSVNRTWQYAERLSRLVTRKGAERMGFLFTWKLSARSRDFKLKVYPSIGYLAVYVVIVLMNTHDMDLQRFREGGREVRVWVISALYFTSLVLTMALTQMVYSEKYRASWIFYVCPLQQPGAVILGAAKAAILKFYIPIVVFVTITGVLLMGPSILPNIILGLFNELLIAAIVVYAGHKMFPFSVHQNTSVKTGSFMRGLFVLFISVVVAGGHFLIYDIIPAVLLCAALSVLATWLITTSLRDTSWDAVRSTYAEQ